MTLHHTELVCARRCGYEAAVGNAVKSAYERAKPRECPRCGADVEMP